MHTIHYSDYLCVHDFYTAACAELAARIEGMSGGDIRLIFGRPILMSKSRHCYNSRFLQSNRACCPPNAVKCYTEGTVM